MTREEIIEAIQHDNTMPFLQDWEARDVVDFVLKNIHPSLPEGLDGAAAQYARDYTENDEGNGGDDWEDDIRITFKAGAKWQAEQYHFFNKAWAENMQAELDRNYENGKQAMKEQMLKEAEEYKVGMHGEPINIALDKYVQRARGIFPGDKVRIIIVKE